MQHMEHDVVIKQESAREADATSMEDKTTWNIIGSTHPKDEPNGPVCISLGRVELSLSGGVRPMAAVLAWAPPSLAAPGPFSHIEGSP
jgi:hypothetical protein